MGQCATCAIRKQNHSPGLLGDLVRALYQKPDRNQLYGGKIQRPGLFCMHQRRAGEVGTVFVEKKNF
jgi:hypothetical protein